MKYFLEEINSMRIHESNNDLSEWGKNKLNEYEFILTELAELKKLRVTDVSESVCDLHDNMNDCDMYRFRKQEACRFCKYKQTVH